MSALPPKADIGGVSSDVRFVPKADKVQCSNFGICFSITSSASAKIHRQLDTRGLCGLEVDELVVCRLLERQISGPRATVDAKFRQSGRDQPPFLGRAKSTLEAAGGFP